MSYVINRYYSAHVEAHWYMYFRETCNELS